MKKKDGGFPYDETPMVHAFPGNADDCFDMVNQYGTYEIQRTADTGNFFPAIAQGLPKGREYFIPIRAVFYKTDSYFYYTPEREFVNRIPFMPGFISSPSKSPGSSRRSPFCRCGRPAFS